MYTVSQGMYAYLVDGGKLCPNLKDELTEDAKLGLARYIKDHGEDGIWLENDCDSQEWY